LSRWPTATCRRKTSLIEARLIAGRCGPVRQVSKGVGHKCVEGHEEEYVAMRLADQKRAEQIRELCLHARAEHQECCGGLRDFQNLLWMSFFKYRTLALTDLQSQGFLSESERKQLDAAYDFLLRVRTEMHYHVNRATDVLGKNLSGGSAQPWLRERSLSKRIEEFMRDVYTHSRNIFLISRTLEQRMAFLPRPKPLMSLRALLPGGRKAEPEPVDGFKFVEGEIHAISNRVFRDQPRRLMRVFLHAQQARAAPAPGPGPASAQSTGAGGSSLPAGRTRAGDFSHHS